MSSGLSPAAGQHFARSICWRCVRRWTGLLRAGGRAMRKADYAACVKAMAPHCSGCLDSISRINVTYSPSCANAIDTQHIEAYLYLRITGAAHGEGGKTAGPEERGAGAGWRPQSQSRSHPRCPVHRQSILRRKRPGPGALRDGATPSSRRRCHQRGRCSVRRYPADLLQGPECLADGWARRSAAEPAGPQRWPQDLCRGHCLRGRSQSREPRADDATMSRRDRARFGVKVHRRSLERALVRKKKRNNPA